MKQLELSKHMFTPNYFDYVCNELGVKVDEDETVESVTLLVTEDEISVWKEKL